MLRNIFIPVDLKSHLFSHRKEHLLFCLLSVLIFNSQPCLADTSKTLHVSWSYDTTLENLAGYRLYQDGNLIYTTTDKNTSSLDREVTLYDNQANSFTMTAFDLLGNESPHSAPFVPPAITAPSISLISTIHREVQEALSVPADTDEDGVNDIYDPFPTNPLEWLDSDNDTIGDNTDACPYDPDNDSDGDSICGNVLPQENWSLLYCDSEETAVRNRRCINAFDNNPYTFWHSEWTGLYDPMPPHEIQIDLGENYYLYGFLYLPRQDGGVNGRIDQFEFYTSADGLEWQQPIVRDVFPNNKYEEQVTFPVQQARYVRLIALSEVNGNPWTTIAEINLLGNLPTVVLPQSPPDLCPDDPDKIEPGTCGCGIADTDSDADGQMDCQDACPYDPENDLDGDGICGDIVSKNNWQLLYCDSEEIAVRDRQCRYAFDDNPFTFWHTEWSDLYAPAPPHEIQIDMGKEYYIYGFKYLPRPYNQINGRVRQFSFYVSKDGVNWNTPIVADQFSNTAAEQTVQFPAQQGRYIRFVALSEVNGNPWTSLAEITILGNQK